MADDPTIPETPVPTPTTPAPTTPATEPTLAEGGGEKEEAAQEVPANWPANWRDIMAGGDQKALAKLGRYASPANVWKALAATSAKISSGELLRSKPDGKDEQALAEWRAQAGIPEKPDSYLEKLPNGLVIGENDKPLFDAFAKEMHDADAPPAVVQKAISWYFDNQEKQIAERHETDKQFRAASEDTLRAEWGPEFRPNQNAVKNLIETYGNDAVKEKLFSARSGDGNALGDDPEVLKFFVAIAREINPYGTVTPTSGQTIAQSIEKEIAAIEIEMSQAKNPAPGTYWASEAKQQRYRELLQMRERQKGRAA